MAAKLCVEAVKGDWAVGGGGDTNGTEGEASEILKVFLSDTEVQFIWRERIIASLSWTD